MKVKSVASEERYEQGKWEDDPEACSNLATEAHKSLLDQVLRRLTQLSNYLSSGLNLAKSQPPV